MKEIKDTITQIEKGIKMNWPNRRHPVVRQTIREATLRLRQLRGIIEARHNWANDALTLALPQYEARHEAFIREMAKDLPNHYIWFGGDTTARRDYFMAILGNHGVMPKWSNQ